ncbi:hypothetical protein LSAT2_025046 [Lamellibrachia satsuma]|nr:hypothetical protein LSAT2_025046 [Lamellibrachia satsuma]
MRYYIRNAFRGAACLRVDIDYVAWRSLGGPDRTENKHTVNTTTLDGLSATTPPRPACLRGNTFGASEDPGAEVITYERSETDNQLWYLHSTTGTIRSKLNDYCLDIAVSECADDTSSSSSSSSSSDEEEIQYKTTLVVNPYDPDEVNQRLRFSDNFIRKRDDPEKVLDVTSDGRVCVWEAHGGDNQKWYFDYVHPRYFRITSELNGKVLDVEQSDSSPGARIITWEKKEDAEDNQLWYEDKHGVIRSKLNDLVLDTSSGILRTGEPEIGNGYQMWQKRGSQIACQVAPNEVLDIRGANTDDGAEVQCFIEHGGENQCWHFEYL